jgi:hypothetical protein
MGLLSGHSEFFLDWRGEKTEISKVRGTMLDKLHCIFSLIGLPAVVLGAIRSYGQGRWVSSVILLDFSVPYHQNCF